MQTTAITTDYRILEDAYIVLQTAQGIEDEDEAIDPNKLDEYDYDEARDETSRKLATLKGHYERYPDLAVFLALAEGGYLDGDSIWDQILQATTDGLRHMVEERWEEYRREQDEDGEDW